MNTILSLICFLANVFIVAAELDYDGKLQVYLEHSLDDNALEPTYVYRGEINVKSLHSGSNYIDQKPMTTREYDSLRTLARNRKIYRVKATVKNADGRQSVFHTFTPACSIVESRLSDYMFINLDHMGNVVAVSLTTEKSCSNPDSFPNELLNFETGVYVRHMDMGPVPDTASYVQRLEKERESKERGDTKDNRSFLAKYWMYIVPVVIFVLISSASSPEGGGGQ